jgi:hypothetical protein
MVRILMTQKTILWIVLQYKPKSKESELTDIEIQGTFSTKEKAILACRNKNYSYMSLELDKSLAHKSSDKSYNIYPIE